MPQNSDKPAPTETVEGYVERITFHNEETGFCVLRVKARGHSVLVTVVGLLPSVHAGEWLTAHGVWKIDPKHGRQFDAAQIKISPPDSIEGIEKYLGSGLIKGIGPHYAARLVKAFGKEVFDVIENRSALLTRVEGIGDIRRTKIKTSWNEQKTVRAIMTFLLAHGVSIMRAFRIYKTYGEEAVEKVRLDPYCLARDIHGIGFKTADQIAENLGIARESELRARAGIAFVLQELSEQGHCAYPRSQLIAQSTELLAIPEEIIVQALLHELELKRLISHPGPDGEDLIYLAALDRAEEDVARIFKELLSGPHPCPSFDLQAARQWVEKQLKIELAPGQAEAFNQAMVSKVLVITGGPGVGKTTVLKAILKVLTAKHVRPVLCAPTGRAAKRMAEITGLEAKTIHRLLAFDPGKAVFRFNRSQPLEGDVFIIDETSMIDVVLASHLLKAIPKRGAVILVGDIDQLPSVGPGCVLRDVIESGVVPVSRLNHVFRQALGSSIVTNAHRVNEGHLPEFPPPKTISDFYFVEAEDPSRACDMVVKLVAESVPSKFRFNPLRDIQVLTPMQKGELGARNLNLRLQTALNPKGAAIEKYGWTYRVSDRVMQIVNDYDKDVFNGDVGSIKEIDEVDREIKVSFDDKTVSYDFQELDELVLAYAMTIHKSQGSEYPCVILPIHTQHFVMLQRNLLYTGITRAKKLVILVGSQKALGMAVRRMDSRKRITTLQERLRY
ncbi:MAG: ATP-dependent RecD-like DNA helicase [Lentisphaerota bacterium]